MISIFSVTDMSGEKSLKVLQFGAALAHIMSTLCYYSIDSKQVNCTVSESFSISPVVLQRGSFSMCSANVSMHKFQFSLVHHYTSTYNPVQAAWN